MKQQLAAILTLTLATAASLAQQQRTLTWSPPEKAPETIRFYSVYQTAPVPVAGVRVKLADTQSLFLPVTLDDLTKSYSWEVCSNNGQLESDPARTSWNPTATKPDAPQSVTNVTSSNVLANGGFETGTNGWTLTGNASLTTAYHSEGSKCLAFNDGNTAPNAILSQTVPTAPGAKYSLAFSLGQVNFGQGPQSLFVSVTGSGTNSVGKMFTTSGASGTNWQSQSILFTADLNRATIRFEDRSQTTEAADPLLDGVRFTIVP